MTTDDRLVTSRKMREYFEISEDTMYRWVSAGCPHLRAPAGKNTRLYFRIAEVEDWMTKSGEQVA